MDETAITVTGKSYIPVRASQLHYYYKVPLYFETAPDVFKLYKPPERAISEIRIDQGMHPRLFIQQSDRAEAIQEVHKRFKVDIARSIESGDATAVKATLCNLMAETLAEPRAGTIQTLPEIVDSLVNGYSEHPGILRTFATISNTDYSTVIHSVNVMALSISFCSHMKLSTLETKRLGLSALLHDVGKTEIPPEILNASRKLTPEEFEVMKSHTSIGGRLIGQIKQLGEDVAKGALEHHEKLDGSGYPKGVKEISFYGQLIGIVDCYEALTNEDRPYRRAMEPLESLKLIREDVQKGKFNRELFEKFCYSLIEKHGGMAMPPSTKTKSEPA